MITALTRKELRQLAPFVFLALFFALLDAGFIALTEFPDQYPLGKMLGAGFTTDSIITIFVLAIAISAGLLTRESTDKTLDFLDSLPVSRTAVFWSKFSTAYGVLLLVPLCHAGSMFFFQALSRNSLDTEFHIDLLVTVFFVESFAAFVCLALGMALSFLRGFSLLVLGLVFWAYVLLEKLHFFEVRLFNFFALGEPVFEGQLWVLPWHRIQAQLALAIVLLGLAWFMFLMLGDRGSRLRNLALRTHRRLGSGPMRALGQLWFAFIVIVVLLVWGGLLGYYTVQDEKNSKPVSFAQWATSRAATAHYDFLYPENLAGEATRIAELSDGVLEKVRTVFGGVNPPGRLVVDLTGELPRHAGRAYWTKIRMNLAPGAPIDELAAVLAHETSHVYIDHLSDSRLFADFDSTRFFHEGLATHVEYRHFRDERELDQLRRIAAVMRSRQQVDFQELTDGKMLAKKWDADLVYPLGEVFVHALVNRHGADAPVRVLQSFARPDAPESLHGMILWQDVFQACGFNLSDVTADFYAELDRSAAKHKEWIDSLPQIRGAVIFESDRVGVKPIYSTTVQGQVVCRFRARADSPAETYFDSFPGEDSTAWISRTLLTERSFWYQLGIQTPDVPLPIYNAWTEVMLSR